MTSTASLPRPAITDITLPSAVPSVVFTAGSLCAQLDAARLASAQLMANRRVAGQSVKLPAARRGRPSVTVQLPARAVAGRSTRRRTQTPTAITV